jgi:acetamidase/formamidase
MPVVRETHNDFDRALEPVLTVASGDVVAFECPGPDLPAEAVVDDLAAIDFTRPHVIAGPVRVEGAEPGDALAVEVLDLQLPLPYGHCIVAPGVGLLPDDFSAPYVHSFRYSDGYARLNDRVRVPIEPFLGIMGVAPAAEGPQPTIPPRRVGGNLDIRDLAAGTTLYLPVEVAGALFSCGDGHAAQGDGEVCVTAIETALRPTLRLTLLKGQAPRMPQVTSPASRVQRGRQGWFVTSWVGDDLLECARGAVREMIDWLVAERALTREEAYVLCSVAVDLRISEAVNTPNHVVTAHLPLDVFVA